MACYLGMDVGGTHTRAILISRQGRVLGVGRAASANYHNVGATKARARLKEAVTLAWRASGKKFGPASHAFLGCGGVKSQTDKLSIRALAESMRLAPAGEVTVENDLHNALAGGLSGRPGIALIAGTGTNCLGRAPGGRTFMCGGWAWLLDDEGGAFGLSLAAVKAVTRAVDGRGATTSLLPAVLAFFGVSDPDDLPACFYVKKWTPGEVAEFAPVVVQHARRGDAVAREILQSGARALANLVLVATQRLNFPRNRPEVVILGGCARSGPPYQGMVEKEIRKACPKIRLIEPEGSPQAGAAFNALWAAGIRPVPKIKPGNFEL
jgi:glucosamine kinase